VCCFHCCWRRSTRGASDVSDCSNCGATPPDDDDEDDEDDSFGVGACVPVAVASVHASKLIALRPAAPLALAGAPLEPDCELVFAAMVAMARETARKEKFS
jgi:hypothetical protein